MFMTKAEWSERFSNRLTAILNRRGMSQGALARRSGLSTSRISDYINKKAVPTVFAITNIADALEMRIGDLIDSDVRIRD